MARLNIADLPLPPPEYRVDKFTERPDGLVSFGTVEDAQAEDLKRA